jgi:hypothetical protein
MGIKIPSALAVGKSLVDNGILYTQWDIAQRVSPIVLDLNGDGIKYIAYNSYTGMNVHFDIDNDGFSEGIEWLSGSDGFLVRDLNANGKIDNQNEMLGDNGSTAYEKLAQYDTNFDGKIDSSDTSFSTLKIWQDANSNGRTDAGELTTLAAKNIASLSLQLTAATADIYGHPIAGTSSFTRTDATICVAADALFDTHQIDSVYVGSDLSVTPTIDVETLLLPLSRGYEKMKAANNDNFIIDSVVNQLKVA